MRNYKVILLGLCLVIHSYIVFSQSKNNSFVQGNIGLTISYPRFNPSGNFENTMSDSVIRKVKDTTKYIYGINNVISFSKNFTKRFYWNIGLLNSIYGVETRRPPRHMGVPNIDSTLYDYILKLRSIELPLGVTYYQELKRSFAFIGFVINPGLIYSSKLTAVERDYTTLEIMSSKTADFNNENFLFGATLLFGFRQYVSENIHLVLSYSGYRQLTKFTTNKVYTINFKSQSYQIGLTYII